MQGEQFKSLHFPLCGINVATAYDRQPIHVTPQGGIYSYTTPDALNMRGVEGVTNRMRGSVRGGLRKYIPTQPGGVLWVCQCLAVIVTVEKSAQQT